MKWFTLLMPDFFLILTILQDDSLALFRSTFNHVYT